MKIALLIFGVLVYSLFSNVTLAAEDKLITVQTSRGATQPFLFAAPDNPKAAVILFVGGDGTISNNEKNFLAKTFDDFFDKGFSVALVDAPSDKNTLTPKFRIGKQHAGDLNAVIDYMNEVADVPVWLIGTSMGTLSAASVAIKKQKRVSGLVLTSTVTRSDEKYKATMKLPMGVLGLNLQKLKKPVLIVAHKGDECVVTPPADASKIKAKLSQSRRVEIVMLEGGDDPKSDPCHSLSQHGFYGIESEAASRIAAFIAQ